MDISSLYIYIYIPLYRNGLEVKVNHLFGSSLPPVIGKRAHVLFTLFVFDCVKWCPTYIMLCIFILFVFVLCLVYPMLLVSLGCPFLIDPSVSLTFIIFINKAHIYIAQGKVRSTST